MGKVGILLTGLLVLCFFLYMRVARAKGAPQTSRLTQVRERVWSSVVGDLKKAGLKPGAPVYVRIFKESRELELWIRDDIGGRYRLYKNFPIATYGGQRLGPKVKQGDGVAPEGFYHVGARQLNPESKFHLAFNVGYPNGYDRFHKRTGDFIMVHGSDVSIGCFAMTDPQIEIIYLLVEAALRGRQDEFQVHIFPFRMTPERLEKEKSSEWYGFWSNLKEGYDHFEATKVPPIVGQREGTYVFKRQTP